MSEAPPMPSVPSETFQPHFGYHEWRAGRDRIWQGLFSKMVEIQQEDPTHYCLANDSTNIIDRIFASVP
eukprot:8729549-Pyramimonas_sp.AAC.1